MKIETRYTSACASSHLTVDPRTTMSDTDVLGAYGLVGKTHPLSVALARLLSGDNRETHEVVRVLSDMIWRKARGGREKVSEVMASDMAKACLAWWRDGVCKACGGHGKTIIPGSPALSDHDCPECRGVGKIAFERNFSREYRDLAAWVQATMEKHLAMAGQEAMRKIAPMMNF
jgi:hypothetical protein